MLPAGLRLALPAVCVCTHAHAHNYRISFESLGTTNEQECLALSAFIDFPVPTMTLQSPAISKGGRGKLVAWV